MASLQLDANATSAPSGSHNNERNDLIASVNEALKLHRGVLEGLAPVRQPLREPGEAVIGARIRDVVVVDLNLTVDDIPKRLTSPVEVVMEAAGDFDVLLRHRLRSISGGTAAFHAKQRFGYRVRPQKKTTWALRTRPARSSPPAIASNGISHGPSGSSESATETPSSPMMNASHDQRMC